MVRTMEHCDWGRQIFFVPPPPDEETYQLLEEYLQTKLLPLLDESETKVTVIWIGMPPQGPISMTGQANIVFASYASEPGLCSPANQIHPDSIPGEEL